MSDNLFNYDQQHLAERLAQIGEPAWRATQIIQWLHQKQVSDFAAMTNLSNTLRQWLQDNFTLTLPQLSLEQCSDDGTIKWLLRLEDGNAIETVLIPERDRNTLCISSQVGCALNCSFCATGHQGFNRNLSTAEIIAQLWLAVRALTTRDQRVTNVVMMGMGEPLLNFDQLLPALHLMRSDHAYGLSKYRVTVSTSGVIPKMVQLAAESDVSLAVSLHAPNDTLRNDLVPLNKKYPLKLLMATCKDYFANAAKRRKVVMEYVMLDGVNDSISIADELIALLRGIPCKVNLIPYNPFPEGLYRTSSQTAIEQFSRRLYHGGIRTTVRRQRGEDIAAACGQLAGDISDRTGRKYRRLIPLRVERSLKAAGIRAEQPLPTVTGQEDSA
ncbi:MAG: 23S rRNA (adenine(2503)-C(2))-methyltransferase RlmN [Gammaproteobacteria bacterium]|nr:23S rRNA (adenine(2503)-C(2))-methyltransferase RlmN [Gammaproteobacteria bacterium]